MTEDLNKDQSVTDQDLNNADAVSQQDLQTQVVTETKDDVLADGAKKADKTVKYTEFEKANEAKKVAEEQAAYAQRQLELYQQSQAQQPAQQTQVSSTYELAMRDLGLTAEDLYDGNNMIKIQNRKSELDLALQQQQAASATNQQFMVSHPDFNQVVGSVNPSTGTIMSWSQEAVALQNKKPWLNGAFQTAQGAYEAIMNERTFADLEKKAAINQEHLNRQGVDTNTQPLGGSAAGSGGAGDTQNQPMMSREKVLEIKAKLAAGQVV